MYRLITASAILGLASAIFSTAASAATFVVNSTLDVQDDLPGDGVCATPTARCTLRAAITEANALAGADLITLPAGTYTTTLVSANEDDNLGGDFDINSDITINGARAPTTIVQAATTAGAATERVFHLRYVTPGTTAVLENMTIRHGRYTDGSYGAGVRVDAGAVIATLNRVIVAANHDANSGGGIAISSANGSVTTLNGCRVVGNTAGGGTGASAFYGAGILLDTAAATLNVNNSRISGNVISSTPLAQGGGIYSIGELNITNSLISDNMVSSQGADSSGGGIRLSRGMATISNTVISGNVATATLPNSNGQGGGITNSQASLVISNSIIALNEATLNAGISTSSGMATTTITDSSIRDNMAKRAGGGIGNNSTVTTITGSTISGNIVTDSTGTAGGLRNVSGTSAFSGIDVFNSTISGNIAARGAGAYNQGTNATLNFNFSTIADNIAMADGGGVLQGLTGSTTLKNSIVADNAAATDPDVSGVVTSGGYNHIEDLAGGAFSPAGGDVVGVDPQLGPLANNGGTTLTHLPAASSPVIDAIPFGINDCALVVTTSQNGSTRPQQIGCEKGSVEVDTDMLFQDGFDGTGTAAVSLADLTSTTPIKWATQGGDK